MPGIIWKSLRTASFPETPGILPGVLVACRYQRVWRDRRTVELHHLPAWVIDCPLTPGMKVRAPRPESSWRERPAGMVHVYAPKTPFWEDNAPVRQRAFAGTYLIFADPAGHLSRLTRPSGGVARVSDPGGLLQAAMLEPFAGPEAPERWRCQAALCRVLALLATARPLGGDAWTLAAPETPDLGRRVDAWLEERLAERVTVAGLARQLGTAPSTFAHRYRAACGRSPMRRLAELRVSRLQALLVHGVSLSLAAPICGFCDAFHASRRFRAIVGRSPSAWLASLGRDRPRQERP